MQIFKIRSKKTGLYSKGGAYPSWSKKGKTWHRIGDLSGHFGQLSKFGLEVYAEHEAELETLEVISLGTSPIQSMIDAARSRKEDRKQREQLKIARMNRERAEKEYNRLATEPGKL